MPNPLEIPILITGTPRSGKSCIGNVLCQAPEFAYFNEPLMIWDAVPRGRRHDRLTSEDATRAVRARIANDCARAVLNAGRRRYLDNLAYHALAIPFVHAVLPQAKIIHVIRDPNDTIPEMNFGWAYRDNVAEAMKRRRQSLRLRSLPRQAWRFGVNYVRSRLTGRRATWGPRVPGLEAFARDHGPAEIAAFQWERMVSIARQDLTELPAGQWLEVRFERLMDDPGGEYRRIAEFARVEDVDSIAKYAEDFIEPDRVFERSVQPSDEEWDRIWGEIGPLCTALGYDRTTKVGYSAASTRLGDET